MVENASTLLMSVCVQAITAASSADITPTHVTRWSAAASIENTGNSLATRYTPATTIVAAWINADTGVGPSIASGSQMCNGNIALFPAPPMNTNVSAHVNNDIQRNDVDAQVLEGLSPQQAVVLHPPDTLADGARVTIRAQE